MVCHLSIHAPQILTYGASCELIPSMSPGRGGDTAGQIPQRPPGTTTGTTRGGFGDQHNKLGASGPSTTLNTKAQVQRERRLVMENVEIQENRYGQGGLNYRNIP